MRGFSLVEVLLALLVLTAGLLSAGQVLFVAAASNSLARSKGAAAIVAQDTLESLASTYQQNPLAADLVAGPHGPRQKQVMNPADGTVLNRFRIDWEVLPVPDPRPGKILDAKMIRVTVTPSLDDGTSNSKVRMNKVLNLCTIFGARTR